MPSESLSGRRYAAAVLRASCAAVLFSAAACGLPTTIPDSPIIDVRWVVPAQSTRLTVDNLLPSGVAILLPDSSGFSITAAAASVTRTLSLDCSACVALNGLNAPKPAFVANASTTTSLPSDIAAATIGSGSLQVQVKNGYTFDPIRPNPTAGSPNGYAVITVSNGSSVVGKDSVNGATITLPAGTTLTRTIPLAGPINGALPLTIAMTLTSPAGENRLIDASKTITVTATPSGLTVANVSVNVVNRPVNSSTTIDLAKVDSSITKHVQGGSLIVALANPFTVAGTLTMKFTPSGGTTITKTFPLAVSNTTPPPILFTKDELQSLLGHSVAVTYTGIVNSPTPVNVSPKQAVVVTTKLDINLTLGGK